MRLICPNCGAQYDVPVEVIPEGGRDVQCSNCGHTWFQRHPDQDSALAEDLNLPLPDPEWTPEDEDDTVTAPLPEAPRPAPQSAPPRRPTPRPEKTPEPETAPPPEPQTTAEAPKPRGIDPDVAEIFREEREYEARQRAVSTLESQPDLGLQEPDEDEQARRSRQARERMARMRGSEPAPSRPAPKPAAQPTPRRAAPADAEADDSLDSPVAERAISEAAAAAAAASSRRDLLPNVDEINQTLRSTAEPRMIDTAERGQALADPQNKGFGKGFLTVVILTALAVGAYAKSDLLSQTVPQAAPVLDAYVTQVDAARVWLDGQVTSLLTMLDGMSGESGQPEAAPAPTATDAPASGN